MFELIKMEQIQEMMSAMNSNANDGEDVFSTTVYDQNLFGDRSVPEPTETEISVVDSNLQEVGDLGHSVLENLGEDIEIDGALNPEPIPFSNDFTHPELNMFLYTIYQSKMEQNESLFHMVNPETAPFKHKYEGRKILKELLKHPLMKYDNENFLSVCANALTIYKLGKNYIECEENS